MKTEIIDVLTWAAVFDRGLKSSEVLRYLTKKSTIEEVSAVLGGIGNLTGAMVGGILLGLIESIGAGYIGDLTGGFMGSHYQDVFAFLVLIVVLVFRPTGIMGERVADRS